MHVTRALAFTVALASTAGAGATTPVSGSLTSQCSEDFLVDGSGGVTLVAFKLGSLDSPDLLFHEASFGGPSIGGISVSGSSYLIPANWREPISEADRAVVLVLTEGHAFIDSDRLLATGGDLGGTMLQVVGALDGVAPAVTATAHGQVLRFTPLLEAATLMDGPTCGVGGSREHGAHVIEGYNFYRLDAMDWPDPTLRDFLVHGFLTHLALAALDFTVLDEGSGLSDRRPGDEFTLQNPDGLPDTGDEVIVFADRSRNGNGSVRGKAPDPARHYWYRVQPVLGGSLDYLARGHFGNNHASGVLLDLDGDGVAESADLLADGIAEFIDPSLSGLGLAHAGELLSSPQAGLAEPAERRADSDGDTLPDDWEIDNFLDPSAPAGDLDTDGDRLLDREEYAIGSHPGLADTDGGGEDDGREVLHGRSPLNPSDDVVIGPGQPLGDLTPAGGGNGRVDVGDVVRILRLAVQLESPTAQDLVVGDLAPADPLPDDGLGPSVRRRGDGRVDITDVVLQLRQAVGLVRISE